MLLIIADRDVRLVEQLARHFRAAGCEVKTAYDALTVLKLLHLETPDAACVGFDMTCHNGVSVCDLLADERRFSFLPVVLITEHDDDFLGDDARDLQARYVTKGAGLIDRLDAVLGEVASHEPAVFAE